MTKEALDNAVTARLSEIDTALNAIPDDTAVDAVALFPEWEVGRLYAVGYRLRYDGKLYKVVQAHTSQADWTPDAVPALYTEVAAPGEIPVWRQPTGAQDAYAKGDRVHWPTAEDPVYESTIDSNVWAPNVYGWIAI